MTFFTASLASHPNPESFGSGLGKKNRKAGFVCRQLCEIFSATAVGYLWHVPLTILLQIAFYFILFPFDSLSRSNLN
jgi:hypothetical protein